MKLREHIFLFVLFPVLVLTVGASYVRFMVIHDYEVAYEGDCDTSLHHCFIGCEDDECTAEYYYSKVTKYAVDLQNQCGTDITDCEAAHVCLESGDRNCSITYCDPITDGDSCAPLGSGADEPTESQDESTDSNL
jgi:hypothetical protein